jgi:hypothetical protein
VSTDHRIAPVPQGPPPTAPTAGPHSTAAGATPWALIVVVSMAWMAATAILGAAGFVGLALVNIGTCGLWGADEPAAGDVWVAFVGLGAAAAVVAAAGGGLVRHGARRGSPLAVTGAVFGGIWLGVGVLCGALLAVGALEVLAAGPAAFCG